MSDHAHPVDPDRVVAAQQGGLGAVDADAMGALLTLLVDPLRIRIVAALLVTDEMCVGDIALALSASEDSATYALRLLRIAGLVVRRREGRMGYYRLRDGDARDELQATLERVRRLARLHLESEVTDDDT